MANGPRSLFRFGRAGLPYGQRVIGHGKYSLEFLSLDVSGSLMGREGLAYNCKDIRWAKKVWLRASVDIQLVNGKTGRVK
jgi:hypothetical protein